MRGPYLAKLNGQFPDEPPEDGTLLFCGIEVKDTAKERQKYHKSTEIFLDEIIARLQSMFPESVPGEEVPSWSSIWGPLKLDQGLDEQDWKIE